VEFLELVVQCLKRVARANLATAKIAVTNYAISDYDAESVQAHSQKCLILVFVQCQNPVVLYLINQLI